MRRIGKIESYCLTQELLEYRELYKIELDTRHVCERKFSSSFSFLFINLTLFVVQASYIFVLNSLPFLEYLYIYVIFFLTVTLLISQIVTFYLSYYSVKLQYLEIPLNVARKEHREIYASKMRVFQDERYDHIILDELSLLGYIRDSYLKCAEHNRAINIMKKKRLLVLDNLVLSCFLLLLTNYFIILLSNGRIEWPFS